MEYSFKHHLKRLVVKAKLLPFLQPLYETMLFVSPWQRAKEKIRQKELISFYSNFIKTGDLCFDVGAYRGNRTKIFLKLGGKVVAVEPQQKLANYLEKKFGKNQNFKLVRKGLSDKEKELALSICEEADDISTFSEKWKTGRFSNYQWNKKEIVLCTTLDNLIKEFGLPVFCKIDVEGFELNVLKGLTQPIKFISFEFTKEFFAEAKLCIDYLVSLGYSRFNCVFGEPGKLFFPKWVNDKEIVREIESINDPFCWGDILAEFII